MVVIMTKNKTQLDPKVKSTGKSEWEILLKQEIMLTKRQKCSGLLNLEEELLKQRKEIEDEELNEVKRMINFGMFMKEIANTHPGLYRRYHKAFKYDQMIRKDRHRTWKTEVYILCGPTGIGKSAWCMEKAPNAFWKQRGELWCDYDGQEDVVIDEFDGWLPLETMAGLMDHSPMMVETKDGATHFMAKRIFITSSLKSWEDFYNWPSEERKKGFKWRIDHVIDLTKDKPGFLCSQNQSIETTP